MDAQPKTVPSLTKVQWRNVLNDAVVGQWYDVDFHVFPPTLAGLKAALGTKEMRAQGWDPDKLDWPGGWDEHLVDYGLRLQFRILYPREAVLVIQQDKLNQAFRNMSCDLPDDDPSDI